MGGVFEKKNGGGGGVGCVMVEGGGGCEINRQNLNCILFFLKQQWNTSIDVLINRHVDILTMDKEMIKLPSWTKQLNLDLIC